MSEQMRKEFEEWFKQAHTGNVQKIDGEYSHGATERLWQSWQASRAAIVVLIPESHNDWLDKQIVEYALVNAGVSYK
jgi:hypothetical protein